MMNVFNYEYVVGHELLFWFFVIVMVLIMFLTIVFVHRELKNENR